MACSCACSPARPPWAHAAARPGCHPPPGHLLLLAVTLSAAAGSPAHVLTADPATIGAHVCACVARMERWNEQQGVCVCSPADRLDRGRRMRVRMRASPSRCRARLAVVHVSTFEGTHPRSNSTHSAPSPASARSGSQGEQRCVDSRPARTGAAGRVACSWRSDGRAAAQLHGRSQRWTPVLGACAGRRSTRRKPLRRRHGSSRWQEHR